mgnify:CR=1 FL=1
MYNNIGRKIKGLAKIIAYGGIVLCIIGGLSAFFILSDEYYTEDIAFIGIIVAVVGSIMCWLSGFFVYGFGELVDQTQQINAKLSASKNDDVVKEKISKLKEWREKGLITENEFQEKLSSL